LVGTIVALSGLLIGACVCIYAVIRRRSLWETYTEVEEDEIDERISISTLYDDVPGCLSQIQSGESIPEAAWLSGPEEVALAVNDGDLREKNE
jgi:hypothetical protein